MSKEVKISRENLGNIRLRILFCPTDYFRFLGCCLVVVVPRLNGVEKNSDVKKKIDWTKTGLKLPARF